jgi:cytidylate kinase
VEALARAQKHWQQREAAGASRPAPTIALAREAGCPGTSVAQEVGARLGWPVYDHELLERIAQEMGLRVRLVESLDERRQSWLLESMQALSSGKVVSEASYVHHLAQTLMSLAAHGKCLIVGRGAVQVLPPETTLRVRLIGQLKDRIAAFAARFGLSAQEAARKVEETDRERVGFIKRHFQKDPTDLVQYDLILNTSRWSVPECTDLVVQAVRHLEKKLA